MPPAVIELRMKQELAIRFEHETRAYACYKITHQYKSTNSNNSQIHILKV